MSTIIAINGGIGCGKSVVSHILATMGYSVYIADVEAKRLMNSSASLKRNISSAFGNEAYKHGSLNASYLAAQVFNNASMLALLNSIVHPAVKEDFVKWSSNQAVSFIETAILHASGLDKIVSNVWTVVAPLEVRVKRVMERNHCTHDVVMQRIAAQKNENDYNNGAPSAASHHVIVNDNTTPVIPQVIKLVEQLQ